MKKQTLKLKYEIQFLGLYDHYGKATYQKKYTIWMAENCKGRWIYYSSDVKSNHVIDGIATPKDWPMFYTMIFSFSHKRDLNTFRKRFS